MGALEYLTQWFSADAVLVFPTQKYIVIKDRTLGFLWVSLLICVAWYILAGLYYAKSYLAIEKPDIELSVWATSSDHAQAETSMHLCFSCMSLPPAYVLTHTADVFVPTALEEVTSFGIKANSSSSCDERLQEIPLEQYRGSACWYVAKNYWLNTEADDVLVGVDHAYSGKGYSPQPCRVQHAVTGELADGVFHESRIAAPLSQWLQWAQVDLDSPLHALSDFTRTSSLHEGNTSTVLRLTGLEIIVRVKYFTHGLGHGSAASREHNCVIQVEPKVQITKETLSQSLHFGGDLSSTSLLSAFATPPEADQGLGITPGFQASLTMSSIEAVGVRLKFETGGEVGHVSLVYMISALTTGIVLVQAAGIFVQAVALFGRGPKSKCYYTVIREEIDVRRIFARYALRCVCAVLLYSMLDADGSKTIDTLEMHSVLYEIFGKYLDDKEIMALTDHLMTTVGLQRGTDKLHYMNQQLTRYSFIDLFTDEDMSVETLRDLLTELCIKKEEEYKEKHVECRTFAMTSTKSKFLMHIHEDVSDAGTSRKISSKGQAAQNPTIMDLPPAKSQCQNSEDLSVVPSAQAALVEEEFRASRILEPATQPQAADVGFPEPKLVVPRPVSGRGSPSKGGGSLPLIAAWLASPKTSNTSFDSPSTSPPKNPAGSPYASSPRNCGSSPDFPGGFSLPVDSTACSPQGLANPSAYHSVTHSPQTLASQVGYHSAPLPFVHSAKPWLQQPRLGQPGSNSTLANLGPNQLPASPQHPNPSPGLDRNRSSSTAPSSARSSPNLRGPSSPSTGHVPVVPFATRGSGRDSSQQEWRLQPSSACRRSRQGSSHRYQGRGMDGHGDSHGTNTQLGKSRGLSGHLSETFPW